MPALRRCDIGGDYAYHGFDVATYRPRCEQPPTHQYRTDVYAAGHWSYRCVGHVQWLDRSVPGMVIEPVTGGARC